MRCGRGHSEACRVRRASNEDEARLMGDPDLRPVPLVGPGKWHWWTDRIREQVGLAKCARIAPALNCA